MEFGIRLRELKVCVSVCVILTGVCVSVCVCFILPGVCVAEPLH